MKNILLSLLVFTLFGSISHADSIGDMLDDESYKCKEGSPTGSNIIEMTGEGSFYWGVRGCLQDPKCRVEAFIVALEASMDKCQQAGGLPVCYYSKRSLEMTSGATVKARLRIQCQFRR